jgi:hypothetical protein
VTRTLRGIVHGKTIELIDSPEVPEGVQVEIVVRILTPSSAESDGNLTDVGEVAPWWTDEDDQIFAQLEQDRLGWSQGQFAE